MSVHVYIYIDVRFYSVYKLTKNLLETQINIFCILLVVSPNMLLLVLDHVAILKIPRPRIPLLCFVDNTFVSVVALTLTI